MPLLPDVGIIGLVPERWTNTWQPRHQVLSRLARYFHVVWVEPALGWRELWLGRGVEDSPHEREAHVPDGLIVYGQDRRFPRFYRPPFLASFTAGGRLREARRKLRSLGCRRVALYIWRPEFVDALDLVEHDLTCYHIDDEYTFSPIEQPIDPREHRLLSRADQVFIHSKALWEKKAHLNPHSMVVPNGVDYHLYATPAAEPADLRSVPRPRIGYVGRVKKQLDFRLLRTLIDRHPSWSFVFVGPHEALGDQVGIVKELSERKNVYMLGGKPVGELAAYTQHLDVCTMCYEMNDYTKFIYPLKLHEYLAAGRPVVGSPIRSLEEFRGIIALAESPEEWSAALSEALTPASLAPDHCEARRTVARDYDWDTIVHGIAGAICGGLGGDYPVRFDKLGLTSGGYPRGLLQR
jgi:glycosyltransferase involved in cell wall biosynthesis